MRVEGGGALVRWALLCALVLGVLGMHHLSGLTHGHGPSGGHAAAAVPRADTAPLDTQAAAQRHCCPGPAGAMPSTPGPGAMPSTPDHGGGHDLLAHLCLAVLTAAGVGLLLVLLRRTRRGPAPPARTAVTGAGHPRPPPPLPTSTRLASLRVLRL
ncbi:hypothetical protein [Saccharothrix algeriensis]|uniref:Uncharacterized protein n=1 Tax=Saccharothrix algeriensis TaxID=173560 RepID=A0A8T8HVD1_9PSEU|nr:hypothetical protein [Saccharothrix algeriensis]MBM7814151.1 hypothetical protein [Saccharothrix algeriensis]QTR02523.1 hypothetical protein J7S33_25990 [Saccharothrix algeriensis]